MSVIKSERILNQPNKKNRKLGQSKPNMIYKKGYDINIVQLLKSCPGSSSLNKILKNMSVSK